MPIERAAAARSKGLDLRLPEGRRPRLLFAEDSKPIRVLTTAMLSAMGCDVEPVTHGEEALNCASVREFDVIVLDIEMPVMDGITAARSIRRLGGKPGRVPLMALSAFLADAMRQASWSDTFDIALPKPANKNELHAAVKSALEWPTLAAVKARIEAKPSLSREGLAALKSGLRPQLWTELAAIACRDIEDCARRLAATRSPSIMVIYAQKLRALGKTFAAPRLASLAEELENAAPGGIAAGLLAMLGPAAQAAVDELTAG